MLLWKSTSQRNGNTRLSEKGVSEKGRATAGSCSGSRAAVLELRREGGKETLERIEGLLVKNFKKKELRANSEI